MPNFAIPLLYRNRALRRHQVVQIVTDPCLITGGSRGDIITWNQQLQPTVVAYPNLSDAPGSVIIMLMLKIPFLQLLDRVESVLLTVHEDQRVRLWDIRDGRCVQVSPHSVFGTAQITFAQPVSPTKCRFVVFGGSNTKSLMLFDLWKMKVCKQYSLTTEGPSTFRSLCKMDLQTMLAIDSQNKLHRVDLSPFLNELFQDYHLWKHDGQRSLDTFRHSELTCLGEPEQLPNLPSKPLLRSHYEEELQLLILVFTNQVALTFLGDKHTYSIMLQPSRNTYKLANACLFNGDQRLLLLTTRQGNVTAVRWNDIASILVLLKRQQDFSYAYREVLLHKVVIVPNLQQTQNTVGLQLNFQLVIDSNLAKHPKSFRKQSQCVAVNNSYTNSKIYQYRSQEMQLYQFSTEQIIAQYLDVMAIFSKEPEHNVQLQGTDLFFSVVSSTVFKEPKEQVILPALPQVSFDFNNVSDDLARLIANLTTPAFQKEIQLDDYFKPSKVVSSLIHKGNYFFGCEDGHLYGFPMFFTARKNYPLYKAKVDSSPLTFLHGKGNILIIVSQRGRLVTLSSTPRRTSQEMALKSPVRKSSQPINRKLEEISLMIGKMADQMLVAQGKALLKIREVVLDLTNEDEEELELQQLQPSEIGKQQVGLQLANNTIHLLSLETGMVTVKFYGIPEHLPVYGLYYEQRSQNYFVLCDDGSIYVFASNGRMDRVLSVATHHPLFAIEQRLEALKHGVEYHQLHAYKTEFSKSISHEHSLLEYQLRGAFIPRLSAYPPLYETVGPIRNVEFNCNDAHKLVWLTQQSQSSRKVHKVVSTEIGNLEWWDLGCSVTDQAHSRDRLVGMLFPWGVDVTLDAHLESLLGNQRPTFQASVGVPGQGYSISFMLGPRWGASEYLTCLQSMAIMHYYINLSFKDNNLMTSLMFQTVELFTKKKKLVDPNFKSMTLCHLATFTIDDSNEIMTAACNLIISQIINKEQDMKESLDIVRSILRQQFTSNAVTYSNVEIICLVVESYCNVFADKAPEPFRPAIDRIINGIDLKNCVVNPHFTAVLLKLIIDGLQYFRPHLVPEKVLDKLFFIFFHYNTALEYMSTLRENPQIGRKALPIIEEFARQSDDMKKRMKQLVVKAIIQVGNLSLQDFYALIRRDILKLDLHILYPCSIIDLIRNYIKSSQQHSIKHLPFLIEIILKSLDPNNPNLRKVCHRAATNALHTVCKMFQCVSFHQATQKIALGSFENQIIIYDLRTAVKWRVLDGHEGQVSALGFDSEGKNLASFSAVDSSLRIWKVGSTGFFGSILGIQGRHIKLINVQRKQVDPNCKISVVWNDQDNMVFLRIGDQPNQQYKVF